MEGRLPPPEASHPFPNNPDMTKFWGTPYSKTFFKCFGVFCATYGAWAGINMYLDRNKTGILGLDLRMTPEQIVKRDETLRNSGEVNLKYGFNFDFKIKTHQFSTDPDMRFDDGVKFNAPIDVTQVTLN